MAKTAKKKPAPLPDFESIEDCKRHITALGKKISAERIKNGPKTPLFGHLVEKQDAAKKRLAELLAPPKPGAKPAKPNGATAAEPTRSRVEGALGTILRAIGQGESRADAQFAAETLAKLLADPDSYLPSKDEIRAVVREALGRTKPTPKEGGNAGPGKARSVIVGACSQPEGATSKELFAATGWKFASWSHQLRLAAEKTGWKAEIRKVDGTTRYFLVEPEAA